MWKKTDEYKRIMEILEDYWLAHPDEERVEVRMYFRRANGEEQSKQIFWNNPNLIKHSEPGKEENLELATMADIEDLSNEGLKLRIDALEEKVDEHIRDVQMVAEKFVNLLDVVIRQEEENLEKWEALAKMDTELKS